MVTDEIAQFHIEQIGNLEEGFDRGLATVGAPLRYRGGILVQLFGKPLVSALLFGQNDLYAVNIFIHDKIQLIYTQNIIQIFQ